jgi:hypothetical protein
MGLVGKLVKNKSNKVKPIEGLPLDFVYGNISVSLSFEGHPSGSINIEKISEKNIDLYRAAYNEQGKEITLFKETASPIYFRVSGYAETEEFIYELDNSSDRIKTYSISINLEGGHTFRSQKDVFIRNSIRDRLPRFAPRVNIKNGRVLLSALARAARVKYKGFNQRIKVDSLSDSNTTLTFQSQLETYLRTKRHFVDYNGPYIQTRFYNKGQRFKIFSEDILSSIQVSRNKEIEYRHTLLLPKDGDSFSHKITNPTREDEKEEELLKDQLKKVAPIEVVLEEGDEYPLRPPRDVTRITTLDQVFDKSGPRKTLKKTKLLNGQPFEEEVFTYGFVYYANQIQNPEALTSQATIRTSALLVEDYPALVSYWRLVEYQKTVYNYENLNIKAKIKAKDESGNKLPTKYLTAQNQPATKFNTKYLTSIVTRGWKLARFQSEEIATGSTAIEEIKDSRLLNLELEKVGITPTIDKFLGVSYSRDPDNVDEEFLTESLKSITFKKIKFKSVTQYKLYPQEDYYKDTESSPFQVQEVAGSDVGMGQYAKVVVAIPDTQWVYPMLLLEETTSSQSFASMTHPKNVYINDERQALISDNQITGNDLVQALAETPLEPDLIVGEDTFSRKQIKILKSKNTSPKRVGVDESQEDDLFTEFTQSTSSHDQKYKNSFKNINFRTTLGRPSNATVFQDRYENVQEGEKEEESSSSKYEYRLYSSYDDHVEVVDQVRYQTNLLKKALSCAKAELTLKNFLSATEEQITLAWYYPELRPGDYLEFLDELKKGQLRVKSVSFSVNYQGIVDGEQITTCEGTQVSLGRWVTKVVDNRRTKKNSFALDNESLETTITADELIGEDPYYLQIETRNNPLIYPITSPEDAI